MDLKNLIRPESVFFIEKTDRMSVLTELAAKSLALGHVKDPDDFYQAVRRRAIAVGVDSTELNYVLAVRLGGRIESA